MNRYAHLMSLLAGILHMTIGLPEILQIGPRVLPIAWAIIDNALPPWLWWLYPGLFTVTGVVAIYGAFNTGPLRIGFWLSALCFGIWGCVNLYAWWTGQGTTIPGSCAFLLLSGYALVLAAYIGPAERSDSLSAHIESVVNKLPTSVQERIVDGNE